jgi:hypothetical protein
VHTTIFLTAATALVAVVAYQLIAPRFSGTAITDYAARYGGPVVVGVIAGLVIYHI